MTPPFELSPLHLRVPATSANLGPGFDMFGIALNLYTEYSFTFVPEAVTLVQDENGRPLDIPLDRNLIAHAYQRLLGEAAEDAPGFVVRVRLDVPTGRGFGSSASALVAGIAAARHVLGQEIDSDEQADVQLLTRMEGHPDNVAPARLGGVILSCLGTNGQVICLRKELPAALGLIVVYPDFTISTEQSRGRLPERLSRADCLSNLKGVTLWHEYLATGRTELLTEALGSDRIHEPYRGPELPGFELLRERGAALGLHGVTISGSGPALLLYCPRADRDRLLAPLRTLLDAVFAARGQSYQMRACDVDRGGLERVRAPEYSTGHPGGV